MVKSGWPPRLFLEERFLKITFKTMHGLFAVESKISERITFVKSLGSRRKGVSRLEDFSLRVFTIRCCLVSRFMAFCCSTTIPLFRDR
ncbi:hypothetical protein CEXT_146461 [Caerostris extrusa]|uniref:Uncharacterized protein n=1 Tax=Caerostris extrusa TaxID=172846 RepID=A0AAV4MJJ4_CAEEX|nr:hypothetical protein CEXT_146461 [Caerostris extrusa]